VTSYLESPDGTQRYQFTNFGVYVDGNLFQLTSDGLRGSYYLNSGYLLKRVYASENCTGVASYIRVGAEASPPGDLTSSGEVPQLQFSYDEIRPAGIKRTYTGHFQLSSTTEPLNLSYWTENGCISINVNQDLLRVNNFLQLAYVYATQNEALEIRVDNFNNCSISLKRNGEEWSDTVPNCVPPVLPLRWYSVFDNSTDYMPLSAFQELAQKISISYYTLIPVEVPDTTGWKIVVK
jgi:hypothetical protein